MKINVLKRLLYANITEIDKRRKRERKEDRKRNKNRDQRTKKILIFLDLL